MLLAPGFGHVAQISGLQKFFGHGQASWREYSILITYPMNAFGSSENNLVAITHMATQYDECMLRVYANDISHEHASVDSCWPVMYCIPHCATGTELSQAFE